VYLRLCNLEVVGLRGGSGRCTGALWDGTDAFVTGERGWVGKVVSWSAHNTREFHLGNMQARESSTCIFVEADPSRDSDRLRYAEVRSISHSCP